jgi:hypothetical protein
MVQHAPGKGVVEAGVGEGHPLGVHLEHRDTKSVGVLLGEPHGVVSDVDRGDRSPSLSEQNRSRACAATDIEDRLSGEGLEALRA